MPKLYGSRPNKAVVVFDGEQFVIVDDDTLGHTDQTGRLHVRAVLQDSNGRVWIGDNGLGVIMWADGEAINVTQHHGIGRRTRDGGRWTRDPAPGDAPDGEPSLHRVFTIAEDGNGDIWFGTSDQGAWRFDHTSLQQFNENDGLPTKRVFAIHVDRDGSLLVGGDGVFRFNGAEFERIF
ncbi:MAG: two-component regulator propeller domain-containing protein [Planctomycetota bacterium]